MRETTRGYAAAVLDGARRASRTHVVLAELETFARSLGSSDELWRALTDGAIPTEARRRVVADLLRGRAAPETEALLTFTTSLEPAGELPAALGALDSLAEQADDRVRRGAPAELEPPAGRQATRERIRGYAERVLQELRDLGEVDEVEDELFRFARVVEQAPDLRRALGDPDLPLSVRLGVVTDLLHDRAHIATEHLVAYVLRAGHIRDQIATIDWLAELAAEERGRRHADVRSAVELDQSERSKLATALEQVSGRQVELRVTIDPSVIGGMVVTIGDTVIDGTIRHRLDRLRETIKL